MHCSAPLGPEGLTRLHVPLDAPPDAEPVLASAPSAAAAVAALKLLPPSGGLGRLAKLRVWECCGAPCGESRVPAGWRVCHVCRVHSNNRTRLCSLYERRTLHCHRRSHTCVSPTRWQLNCDGLNFCSRECARSRFRRALVQCAEGEGVRESSREGIAASAEAAVSRSFVYQLQEGGPHGWPGPLAKGCPKFANIADAMAEFSRRSRPAKQGTPLYRARQCTRPLPTLPNVAVFPQLGAAPSPASHFLAHYDAAGGGRPYGMHAPWFTGSKLSAIAAAVRKMLETCSDSLLPDARGSKAVVFSASIGTLQLLAELLSHTHGAGAVAFAHGGLSQAERAEQIATFHADPQCVVLLLTVRSAFRTKRHHAASHDGAWSRRGISQVGACASGLNLTVADHCFLVCGSLARPVALSCWSCGRPTSPRLLGIGRWSPRPTRARSCSSSTASTALDSRGP